MAGNSVRSTVYFDPDVHQALRLRAAADHQSISEIVNAAVKAALQEPEADRAAQRRAQAERALALLRQIQTYASSGGRRFSRDEMNERR